MLNALGIYLVELKVRCLGGQGHTIVTTAGSEICKAKRDGQHRMKGTASIVSSAFYTDHFNTSCMALFEDTRYTVRCAGQQGSHGAHSRQTATLAAKFACFTVVAPRVAQ